MTATAAAGVRQGRQPRVIGIDPSLTATGIASSLGWCRRIGQDDVTKLPVWARADALVDLADRIVEEVGDAELVVAERVAAAKAYGGASERAGLFWLIARRLRSREIPFVEATPQHGKIYATGNGNASKKQVIAGVRHWWPHYSIGSDDNLADAVTFCAMGADELGHPLAAEPMPATHRRALAGVTWPWDVAA